MATYSGKDGHIKIGTFECGEMGDWSIDMSRDEIDTTSFGDSWGKSDVGMGKWSMTFNGFFDPTETCQDALIDAFQDGSLIDDLQLFINNTSKWQPNTTANTGSGVRVTSLQVGQSKGGVASLAVSLSGSGQVTFL